MSAPRNSEEGRALLQDRLKRFGRLGALIGLVFLVIGATSGLLLDLPGTWEASLAQAGTIAVGTGVWIFARRGRRRTRALLTIDLLSTWSNCALFVALAWRIPLYARPELIALICIGDILALRAYWIPSSPRRTLVITGVPLLALITSTALLYAEARPHPDAPGWQAYTAIVTIFALGTLLVTTLTSRTIFGLRQRVREAFQLGQYTLTEKIGEGGMGVVYKARHATLRRPTAIKLLPPERAGEHNLARFEREVQLTSQLTHPNTVSIYDYGRSAEGVLYYAMEFLDGADLESVILFAGAQPPTRVVHILLQVCAALEEAHALGLIHRDVKPQNVILCSRGGVSDVAKVVDFGLVKELAGPGRPEQSLADHVVGTPLYMSPESIARPSSVDARADLYSLGALGYFLVTGHPPFSGATSIEVCGHHLHSTPERPSQRLGSPVPDALERVLLACLEKDPARRPASAQQLAEHIRGCEIDRWTREQASAWWTAHGAELTDWRRSTRGPGEASTMPVQTLAIDLAARRPSVRPWQSTPLPDIAVK